MANTCQCERGINLVCELALLDVPNNFCAFPECQVIPDGTICENPFFDTLANRSYYTYLLSTQCGNNPIQTFTIPVCENIPSDQIIVEGRFGACEDFISLPIQQGTGIAPPGFKLIQINVNGLLGEGSNGVFRFNLSGNYPLAIVNTSLSVATTTSAINVPGEWYLASCPPEARLTVTKECESIIQDQQAFLNYFVIVGNTGNQTATDIAFTDQISYSEGNVIIGNVTVPDGFTFDLSTPGIVRITGTIPSLAPGESVELTYMVSIAGFNAPGTYRFINTVVARSGNIEGTTMCSTTIEVVSLQTELCCITPFLGNTSSFNISIINLPNSPETQVVANISMMIPSSATVSFVSFGNCTAFFNGTTDPVPLNTPLSNVSIVIVCEADIPENARMDYVISFLIVGANFNGGTIIANFNSLMLREPDEQILLNAGPLPIQRMITVSNTGICQSPCSEG